MYHWQDRSGAEVDIILEAADGRVAAIEIKTGQTVKPEWFRWLRQMRDTIADKFTTGIALSTPATTCCPSATGSSPPLSRPYGNSEMSRSRTRWLVRRAKAPVAVARWSVPDLVILTAAAG